jgi:WD40 repeat protein
MPVRRLKLPLVGTALLLAVAVFAAQRPNPADDPLPKGATVRFGVSRPILRKGPGVALLPPDYTNFLAPTMTGGVRRYDLGTGRPLQKGPPVGPGQVVVSADGKRAAVARPGALTVVEVATGKQLLAVRPPEGVIIVGTPGVSLSADGKVLAYGSRGRDGKGAVVVWGLDNDVALAQVETAQAAPVYPTLSADGKTLVTHGPPAPAPKLSDGNPAPPPKAPRSPAAPPDALRTAQVWEVASGKELFKARVTGMGGMVVAAALSPDGELLAVSAGDGPVDLWEVKTGKRLKTLLGRKGQGVRVAFSPNGQSVASVGPDYRIQRWATDGKPLGVSEPPANVLVAQLTGLTFTDNERAIAWMTSALFAVAWESPTGKLLSPEMDHLAAVRSIAFPDDGKAPLSSGYDARVLRWDRATGQLNETLPVHPARIPGQPIVGPVVTLSADGSRATWLRPLSEVFDMANGEHLFCVPPPSSPPAPTTSTLSPDGMKLITLSRQTAAKRTGSCVVWDLATEQRVAEFDIPATATPAAPGAALSPSGDRIVIVTTRVAATGRQALILTGFDLKTGKKLGEVEDASALAGTVTVTVAVANDTEAVVASSLGRVWAVDYVKGQPAKEFDRLPVRGEPPVHGPVAFSPDGKRFATGVVGEPFTTYGVRVYDWPRGQALHTFIGHVGPVTALRFTPDGNYLASGAQDTSVLLWDLRKLPAGK